MIHQPGSNRSTQTYTNTNQKHEVAETYEHEIQKNKHILKLFGIGVILLSSVSLFLYLAVSSFSHPEMPIVLGLVTIGALLPQFLLQYVISSGLKDVSLKWPSPVVSRVFEAHKNVSPFLTKFSERVMWSRLLERLLIRYDELDKLTTNEIRKQLEDAGVWNRHAQWYGKGKTLEEGLMLAIYSARSPEQQLKIEATEKEHEKASRQAEIAADLQQRKERQQRIEALERELASLKSQSQQAPKWEVPDE
jgi:hypothetical protein